MRIWLYLQSRLRKRIVRVVCSFSTSKECQKIILNFLLNNFCPSFTNKTGISCSSITAYVLPSIVPVEFTKRPKYHLRTVFIRPGGSGLIMLPLIERRMGAILPSPNISVVVAHSSLRSNDWCMNNCSLWFRKLLGSYPRFDMDNFHDKTLRRIEKP